MINLHRRDVVLGLHRVRIHVVIDELRGEGPLRLRDERLHLQSNRIELRRRNRVVREGIANQQSIGAQALCSRIVDCILNNVAPQRVGSQTAIAGGCGRRAEVADSILRVRYR